MKLFGFYITRVDFAGVSLKMRKEIRFLQSENMNLLKKLSKQSETYTDKKGKLRFKHNGQFAPDNRTAFRKTHDRLIAERKARDFEQVPNWGDLQTAYKNEEFGR